MPVPIVNIQGPPQYAPQPQGEALPGSRDLMATLMFLLQQQQSDRESVRHEEGESARTKMLAASNENVANISAEGQLDNTQLRNDHAEGMLELQDRYAEKTSKREHGQSLQTKAFDQALTEVNGDYQDPVVFQEFNRVVADYLARSSLSADLLRSYIAGQANQTSTASYLTGIKVLRDQTENKLGMIQNMMVGPNGQPSPIDQLANKMAKIIGEGPATPSYLAARIQEGNSGPIEQAIAGAFNIAGAPDQATKDKLIFEFETNAQKKWGDVNVYLAQEALAKLHATIGGFNLNKTRPVVAGDPEFVAGQQTTKVNYPGGLKAYNNLLGPELNGLSVKGIADAADPVSRAFHFMAGHPMAQLTTRLRVQNQMAKDILTPPPGELYNKEALQGAARRAMLDAWPDEQSFTASFKGVNDPTTESTRRYLYGARGLADQALRGELAAGDVSGRVSQLMENTPAESAASNDPTRRTLTNLLQANVGASNAYQNQANAALAEHTKNYHNLSALISNGYIKGIPTEEMEKLYKQKYQLTADIKSKLAALQTSIDEQHAKQYGLPSLATTSYTHLVPEAGASGPSNAPAGQGGPQSGAPTSQGRPGASGGATIQGPPRGPGGQIGQGPQSQPGVPAQGQAAPIAGQPPVVGPPSVSGTMPQPAGAPGGGFNPLGNAYRAQGIQPF